MTRSPHATIPWHDQTLEQLREELAYFEKIAAATRNMGLHAANACVATIRAWIDVREADLQKAA